MAYPRNHIKFILKDYSKAYFKTTAKKDIPQKRTGKFIQTRKADTEYLVLAPKELKVYHANIVERFFMENGIKGKYNKKHDYYKIDDPDWEIVGGGTWKINEKDKTLLLSGSSKVYGKFDRRGIREKILGVKGFSDYEIKIE